MKKKATGVCTTCIWARDLGNGKVACANEEAVVFRQIRAGRDTCDLHSTLGLIDRAEYLAARRAEA